MFKNRTTGEFLIMLVGLTVCGYVLVSFILMIVLLFAFPEKDLSSFARNISDIINTLIGLLAGFLAGRTDTALIKRDLEQDQKKDKPEEPKP